MHSNYILPNYPTNIQNNMEKEELSMMAKLAEQAERYEDMVKYMKELTSKGEKLTDEERNLLSVAFKNVVGARRSAWRIISAFETKDKDLTIINSYRMEIENELQEKCNDVLGLIEDHLLKQLTEEDGESKVFYLKMKGDYYRYLVEVTTGEEREGLAEKSKEAYENATQEASSLASTHPIKLGLALNFSVFHYEIMTNGKEAERIAKTAFDDAIKELDNLKEESYKDSTLIMQLLRDNLTLWTSEVEGEDQQDEGEA